ncbi:MAG: hypothetical protein AAGD07_23880 [Planctomycetota bacterium]
MTVNRSHARCLLDLSVRNWPRLLRPDAASFGLPMVIVLFCLVTAGCSRDGADYPPSPFGRAPEGFPQIVALDDEPPYTDEAAYDAYWDEMEAVFQRSLNDTILAEGSEQEKEVFVAVWESRYPKARRLAEELLDEDPQSLVGLYGIANVEAYAEGDLAYGLNAIRRVRQISEERGRQNPRDPIAMEWYVRALDMEVHLLGEMDRNAQKLVAVDRLESVMGPLPWLKTWALIKLERVAEARQAAEAGLARSVYQLSSLNGLASIEDKLHQNDAALQAAREASRQFPESGLLLNNLGLAETLNLHFDKAERAFLQSADAEVRDFEGTPYLPLATLLMQQGRFAECMDALKEAQMERGEREPYTLQQDEASFNITAASLLLAYNELDLAWRFARSAIDSPDRAGTTSNDQRDLDVSNDLIAWAILKSRQHHVRLQRALGVAEAASRRRELASIRLEMWKTRQRFQGRLTKDDLVRLVNPYLPGCPNIETRVQSWHRMQLPDLVPTGILWVAVEEAANQHDRESMMPYWDSMRCVLSHRDGDSERTLAFAKSALDGLPSQGEKVLRAHVAALAGQAAWQQGDFQQAKSHWMLTLRDFPQSFRLLAMAVPVQPSVDASSNAREIGNALLDAGCFVEHPSGFPLRIRSMTKERMTVELLRRGDAVHADIVFAPPNVTDVPNIAANFIAEFFQPLLELSQTDLGSLDGSPVAARFSRSVDSLLADFIAVEEDTEQDEE